MSTTYTDDERSKILQFAGLWHPGQEQIDDIVTSAKQAELKTKLHHFVERPMPALDDTIAMACLRKLRDKSPDLGFDSHSAIDSWYMDLDGGYTTQPKIDDPIDAIFAGVLALETK